MTTLQQIDLSDHDAFDDRVPYEWFTTLRARGPGPLEPRARRPRLLRRHPLRRHPRGPPPHGALQLRARRHVAGGPRARPDRGAQVHDRHGPAAPRRAARPDRPPLHAARRAWCGRRPCARSPTACSTRARAGGVRLRPRDQLRDPDAGLRRDPRRAAGGAPLHHRARRPAARQPGPGVRAADRRQPPAAAVLLARRARDVRVRPQDGRGAAQGTRATTSSPSSRSSR